VLEVNEFRPHLNSTVFSRDGVLKRHPKDRILRLSLPVGVSNFTVLRAEVAAHGETVSRDPSETPEKRAQI
jgi:hypothetical protein